MLETVGKLSYISKPRSLSVTLFRFFLRKRDEEKDKKKKKGKKGKKILRRRERCYIRKRKVKGNYGVHLIL